MRSRNHCCRGKTSITYVSVCVRPCGCPGACMCVRACSLANPTSNAHAPYCIVICGLSGSTTCLHITSQTAQFSERSKWTFNLCFGFLYNFYVKHFSFLKFSQILSQMWKSLQVKYQLFFSDLIKLTFLDSFQKKILHIKFYQNPPSGCRVVPCGCTDRHDEANNHFSQFCYVPENV